MARSIAVVLLLALPWASPVVAQAVLRLRVDNDAFAVGYGHDRDYTHGLDASIGRRRCDGRGCRVVRIGLAHALYTPDLRRPVEPPTDRAFAGYVGLRGGLEHWTRNGTWQVTATVGVRGPLALGEPVQRFVHGIFDFVTPPSWDRQLPTAPWLTLNGSAGRWVFIGPLRLGATGRVDLGTMQTLASAGLRLSVGADARWLDPRPVEGHRFGLGFEVGERWYAYDGTLRGIDGGAGVRGVRSLRPRIGFDLTYRVHAWAMTFSMGWLGRDFDGQATAPLAGTIEMQWTP
jgi:hypothetical protein